MYTAMMMTMIKRKAARQAVMINANSQSTLDPVLMTVCALAPPTNEKAHAMSRSAAAVFVGANADKGC